MVQSRGDSSRGLLDLAILTYVRNPDLKRLAAELEDPANPDNKLIYYRQLAEFTIESKETLHCNLDGEPVSKKKFEFSVLPSHLSVAY